MKSLTVLLLSVLFIQATTGRNANGDDSGEYEEHEERSITYSRSNKPGQVQSTQTIMRSPSFPTMSFGLNNPGRQSFGSLSSGGLSAFPSFNSFPGFPSFGQMSAGSFGGSSAQRPGGLGLISGFFRPGSGGSGTTAQAGAVSSSSSSVQGNTKPGFTFTQTSSIGPGSSQASASSQSSSLQNGQASDAEEQEPSIAIDF